MILGGPVALTNLLNFFFADEYDFLVHEAILVNELFGVGSNDALLSFADDVELNVELCLSEVLCRELFKPC